jgi:ketosteroid isomerase-like protein
MIEKGRYLVVYKRQSDGSWKVIEDMGNDEAPPQPAKE